MNSNLFIRGIFLKKHKIESYDEYPFNIDVVKNFDDIDIEKPVTFLVGENGVGKSTFIEALAVALNLNPEGGTQNFNFRTNDTHSILSEYIGISKYGTPQNKFFLRAESFYNVASEIDRLGAERYYGGSLHECSHGESFIQLIINRFGDNGLYILDEPEAALSPQRQMTLLCLIDDLVKKGSQFIIATHSPILISYINGEILDLNQGFKKVKYEETEIYQTYKMYLNNPYGMQRKLFEEE